MPLSAFVLALLALLATPGPTNTLLALAGSRQGRAAATLLPAELLGYLAAVLPLSLARLWVDPAAGSLGTLLQIAAAVWVASLALRLGLQPPAGACDAPQVTPGRIFLTTLLNPKVLVVALVLMQPPSAPGYLSELAAFILLVPLIGLGWTRLGALLQGRGHPRRARLFQQGAALWLAALALGLAHRALTS